MHIPPGLATRTAARQLWHDSLSAYQEFARTRTFDADGWKANDVSGLLVTGQKGSSAFRAGSGDRVEVAAGVTLLKACVDAETNTLLLQVSPSSPVARRLGFAGQVAMEEHVGKPSIDVWHGKAKFTVRA